MTQSIAQRLLPHCPTGPVLDMLVSSTGTIPTSKLTGVPSEEVSWRLYKRLPAEAACVLVEHATSPDLLRKIFAKEKRVSVRRAFARNPHLPEDLYEALARKVEETYDAQLARDLLGATPPEKRIPLLVRPGFHSVRDSHEITNAVLGMDAALRDDLVFQQRELLTPAARWHLASYTGSLDALRPDTLLDLIIDVPAPPRTAVDTVVKAILDRAAPADRPHLAADILEYMPEPGALTVLTSSLTECGLTLSRVLGAARGAEDRLRVWAAAIRAEIEIDLDLARLLLPESDSLSDDQRKRLRCTPEALALLLREGSLGLQAALLGQTSAAACVQVLNSTPELRPAFRCSAERLEELFDGGLDPEVLVELIQSAGRQTYSFRSNLLLTPRLRAQMVATGPREIFTSLDLTPEEAGVLLAREEVRADPELALYAFARSGELLEELRREVLCSLPSETIATLLQSDRASQMRQGDLTWLLTTCHGGYLRSQLPEAVSSYFVQGPWVEEAVALLALPWTRLTNPRALKALTSELLALLGDDLPRWHAALALLPEWEGSLPELVDTLDQLT